MSHQHEFPIVCDECLGGNQYVRMSKRTNGTECRFCQRVYTSFQWKRAKTSGLMKTEICPICATMKNLCQSCVLDLEFHLPSYVRDSILPENDDRVDTSSGAQIGKSAVANTYNAEQAEKMITEGGINSHVLQSEMAPRRDHLLSLARSVPYQLTSKDTSDRKTSGARPPKDLKTKSLYIGGIDPSLEISEPHLQVVLQNYGTIQSIKMVPQKNCAFVTFQHRAEAESCIDQLYNKLSIKGTQLKLLWAKAKKKKKKNTTVTDSMTDEDLNTTEDEKQKKALLDFLKQPNKYLIPPPGSNLTDQQPPTSLYPSMTPAV
jgi:pre-mRNA-splicing factor RBM22/SLT11